MKESIVKRIVLLSLLAGFAILLTACDGQECQEPRTEEEIDERVLERVEDYMDAMDAYPMQREKVQEILDDLKPRRIELARQREKLKDQFIDQLLTGDPDRTKLKALVEAGRKQSMGYTWEMIERAIEAHQMFTTEQRGGVIDILNREPREFSVSFLVRRGIDIFLVQLDATSAQKKQFWSEVSGLENETNTMIKANHAIRLELGHEWVKKDLDSDFVRKKVRESEKVIVAFINSQVDRSLRIFSSFSKPQLKKLEPRLEGAKTCAPGQSP